jgi:hypothetical protein
MIRFISVVVVTGLLAGELRNRGLIPGTYKRPFSSLKNPKNLWAPPRFLLEILRSFYPGVKRPGHEADHTPPYSSEFKNVWSYTYVSPYAFIQSIGTT